MRKIQIRELGIYAVIDREACARGSLKAIAEACVRAKVKIIQLRDKTGDVRGFYQNAILIRKITRAKALFIINDRLDIARLVDADGLHIGQDDLPPEAARRLLGQGKIIGKSCHSLTQALTAEKEKVDYISVGPIFSTPTKPLYRAVGLGLLRKVISSVNLAVTAIGGIDKTNIGLVREAGARNFAVVRAICKARDVKKSVAGLWNEWLQE